MELDIYILREAMGAGICQPWAERIKGASVEELLDMYVAGIDFCLANNFPSNSDLARLGGDLIAERGIYIDSVKKLVDRPFVVALGACGIHLSLNDHQVGQVFVKHSSTATIQVKDSSFAVIDCFDQTSVAVVVDKGAKALVNVYGDARVIGDGEGMIKVVRKGKLTY